MKGVILAGGTGSRLRPYTDLLNKHLMPVGPFPMIHHSITLLRKAGITEILLILGKPSASLFIDYLGDGERLGVDLTYRIQEQPGGIAQALMLAESFVGGDSSFAVLLGDNLFEVLPVESLQAFEQGPRNRAHVFLTKVQDPERYGVPVINEQNRIVHIEEKPQRPASPYCVTGLYLYGPEVFGMVRMGKPSHRGEWEITDVNNRYAEAGHLTHTVLDGWWTDAGTPISWFEANARWAAREKDQKGGLTP